LIQIDAGGQGSSSFMADTDFNNGNEASTANSIGTTGVTNAAPEAVYQTVRWAALLHLYRAWAIARLQLHSAAALRRTYFLGSRGTGIQCGNQRNLSPEQFRHLRYERSRKSGNYGVVQCGCKQCGQIVIAFTAGSADNPEVNGIEVLQ
jgi:hypothetical protein